MDRCPSAVIPSEIWETLGLFWHCHTSSGASIMRTGYPDAGGLLEQDAWLMWAFDTIHTEYQVWAKEKQVEKRQADELAALHAKMSHGHN